LTEKQRDTIGTRLIALAIVLWASTLPFRPVFGVYEFDHYLETTHGYRITFDATLYTLGSESTSTIQARVQRHKAACDDSDEEDTYCWRPTSVESVMRPTAQPVELFDVHCEQRRDGRYTCPFTIGDIVHEIVLLQPAAEPEIDLLHEMNNEGSLPSRVSMFVFLMVLTIIGAFGAVLLIAFIAAELQVRAVSSDESYETPPEGETIASRLIGALSATFGLLAVSLLTMNFAVSAVSYLWDVPSLMLGLHFVVWP
jgi:hypothetical protein